MINTQKILNFGKKEKQNVNFRLLVTFTTFGELEIGVKIFFLFYIFFPLLFNDEQIYTHLLQNILNLKDNMLCFFLVSREHYIELT